MSLIALFIIAATVLGAGLGQIYKKATLQGEQKPVINVSPDIVSPETQVVFEQYYLKCGHTIISAFPQRESLNGKTINQIQEMYNSASSYQVQGDLNTLLFKHSLDDWCPHDKAKLRLKEYQGQVAVYQGPEAASDALIKVTRIPLSVLPPEVQRQVKEASMEFYTQEELNDALENLDEYF